MSANSLFDAIKQMRHLKTDVQLSKLLDVGPGAISKMRHESLEIGATIMVSIHEETDWPTKKIKAMIAEEDGFNGVDIDRAHLTIKEKA